MNIIALLLAIGYLAGFVWMMYNYSDPSTAKLEEVWAYRFGWIMATIIWPLFAAKGAYDEIKRRFSRS